MGRRGRPEHTPLANLSHLRLQRWRAYGDRHKFKVSICCNCSAKFEEPDTMNLMACPLCANHLWKKKNYPPIWPPALPNNGCLWCGARHLSKGRYCDEWCRDAMTAHKAREYQRKKHGQDPEFREPLGPGNA